MTKNGNGRALKLAGFILSILIIGAGIVAGFTLHGADIAENGKDIDMLDTIVCDPKEGLVVTQAVMMERQKVMQKKVDAIAVDTKEILKKLK